MLSDISVLSTMNETGEKHFSNMRLSDKLLLQKKTVTYLLLSLPVACIVLFLPVLYLDGNMANLVLVTGFLILGILHNAAIDRRIPSLSVGDKVVLSFIMTAVVIIFLGLAFYLFSTFRLLPVLAAGCAFLLPFNVGMLWPLFHEISFSEFSPWYFSKDLTVVKSTVFLNSIPIRFNVKSDIEGEEERRIAFRAPVRMKLWLIFYHMVQELNLTTGETIDLSGKNDTYGWIFYTNSLAGWRKNLDPESTLVENGIRQNTIITARRVSGKALKESSSAKATA